MILASLLLIEQSFAIVGGSYVSSSNKYPWLITLKIQGKQACAGTLINPTTVITAAHCSAPLLAGGMGNAQNGYGGAYPTAEANRLDLTKTCKEEECVSFEVTDIIAHPQFQEYPNFANDVGIWKVKAVSGYLSGIKVDLDDGTFSKVGKNLTAVGWGMTKSRSEGSDQLLKITSPVVESNQCLSIYSELQKSPANGTNGMPPPGYDPASSICAGNMRGKESICHGDSGGPLFTIKPDGTAVLVGISSHANAFDCATRGVPDIFAKVNSPSIKSFILSNI